MKLLVSILLFAGVQANAQSLDGTWTRACDKMPDGKSFLETLVVAGNSLDFRKEIHAGDDCSMPLFQFNWSADFVLSNTQGDVSDIDFVLTALTAKALNPSAGQEFEKIKFCGIDHWANGQQNDVAGKMCGNNQLGSVGYKAFNRVAVSADTMSIDFNESKPASQARPAMNPSVIFKKQ